MYINFAEVQFLSIGYDQTFGLWLLLTQNSLYIHLETGSRGTVYLSIKTSHMVYTSAVVIDGRAHMYGRLASIVAKQLLQGQSIVVVRAEQMVISGSRECHYVVYVVGIGAIR